MPYIRRRFAKKHSHRYFVDLETQDAVCLCGRVRGSKKAAKGKYNARRCFYNGAYYDSTFEATYAMQLDWRKRAKDIKDWDRQYPVRIEIGGEHILTTRVDFRVHENDGSYTLVETKGFETPDYKIKKKLIEVVWLKNRQEYTYVGVK
jgi:hypothetical protein